MSDSTERGKDVRQTSADYWNHVEAVFAEAVVVTAGERGALLDARCAGHPDLRAEVESLLAVHARASGFLPHLAEVSETPATARAGDLIGPFRLAERIGTGGMGAVYRAERADGGFTQRVAIKVLAAPLNSPDAARRFRAERQILASLQHPSIVSLIDGGVTAHGQAYLVMELVDGVPITTYCRERAMSIDGRVRLFRQVCAAVQYAHRHFIVHRDLKPANILVTAEGPPSLARTASSVGEAGVPKVLDFGVAKLLQGSTDEIGATATGLGGPMTPNYASPEQVRGLPVTVASDVYALGVILFELLSGTRPYETAGKPADEVMRLVIDTDTTRPSAAQPPDDARPPYEWRRLLRGDLDAIVLRTLRKAPEERYASVEALSEDLGRYLDGQPVEARQPSLGYVVRKLAARHRAVFASLAVSLVVIIAVAAIAVWEARVATIERDRAERRFSELRQLANSLVFKIHDAVAPLPGSTPVRQMIVAEGLKYLEGLTPAAQDDPALQLEVARAYLKIGEVQGSPTVANLGKPEDAIVSFRKAQALTASLATQQDASLGAVTSYVDASRFLSQTLMSVGRRPDAIQAARNAVTVADSFARRHPSLGAAKELLASGHFSAAIAVERADALPYWQGALTAYESLLAERPDDPGRQHNVAVVEKNFGGYFEAIHDYAAALPHHERALELDEQRLARFPDDRVVHRDVAIDFSNIAFAHWMRKELPEAVVLYERSLAIRQRVAASDPKDVLARARVAFIHRQLGSVASDQGDRRRALAQFRRAVTIYQDGGLAFVEPKANAAFASFEVGRLEASAGRTREACGAFGQAFEWYRTIPARERVHSADHGGPDPLPHVAREAARCGVDAARQWLGTHPDSPPAK